MPEHTFNGKPNTKVDVIMRATTERKGLIPRAFTELYNARYN